MRHAILGLLLVGALAACSDDIVVVDDPGAIPAAPRALAASYYAGQVRVTWELAPDWNGEAFRVYSRRVTDTDWFFTAEVTSCQDDFCLYEDLNVVEDVTYEYIVSAVNGAGVETDSDYSVEVYVPVYDAPPVPDAPYVVALDNANYLVWGAASRGAADFSHYRVYLDDGGAGLLLGETDSEGFLDLLAANGSTYGYWMTAVDADGHESSGSIVAEGTPRPDYTAELVYDHFDDPTASGFRFAEDEADLPVTTGDDPLRHFRVESDVNGWWLVPGPGTSIYMDGIPTTALKCGVAADFNCVDVATAPTSGYVTTDVPLDAEHSYVFRVIGNDSQVHYGVIRAQLFVTTGSGDGVVFDWAYQLQAGNPNLAPGRGD